MKQFPMIDTILKLFIALTVGVLEKILTFLYLCLPIGLFMLVMSFKDRSDKTTALSVYTKDYSEFQHIFPNFILVIVEPRKLKRELTKNIDKLNATIGKYNWILIFSIAIMVLAIIVGIAIAYLFYV